MDRIGKLSALLVDSGLISIKDMVSLHKDFKNRDNVAFEDFLLEEGIVSKEDLLKVLSKYYRYPAFDVVGAFFDHQFLHLIPKSIMLEHNFIPYKREIDSDVLTVVAATPDDPHLLEVLGRYVSHEINFMVGIAQDIKDAIREFYDESITYQPNYIQNQNMERSMIDVHPMGEQLTSEDGEREIPLVWQQSVDDSERY